MLVAARIQRDGKRTILGVSVALREHEIHGCSFMKQLLQRGLTGGSMIPGDDHAALRGARKAIFGACSMATVSVTTYSRMGEL